MTHSTSPSGRRTDATRWVGFTLVELMVVVVIISILAAVVLPVFLDKLVGRAAADEHAVQAPALLAPGRVEELESRGVPPRLDDADIAVALSAMEHRIGTDVFSRFTARYRGEFTVRGPAAGEEHVRLRVPLPRGTTEAEDVFLTLRGGGYDGPPSREQVEITERGIVWVGSVPAAGADADRSPVVATVGFTARGRDRFVCDLPPARGMGHLRVVVSLEGVPRLPTPDGGLEPKKVGDGTLEWDYRNLVSRRPLIVALPAAEAPLERVVFLLELMGVAVLLFGAGFWYLVELYAPGRLDTFRWGHFLLLALTYSLFFAVFAVLGFNDVELWTAVGIAAALSIPLLVLHVSTIVDGKFAAKYTLPLAAFTIGMVVNGVYGGELRSYVYLGGAFAVVAYLTLTYQEMAQKREARRALLDEELFDAARALEEEAAACRQAEAEAAAALSRDDSTPLVDFELPVAKRRKELDEQLEEHAELVSRLQRMRGATSSGERGILRESLAPDVRILQQALVDARAALQGAVQRLLERRADSREELQRQERDRRAQDEGRTHCIACGHGWDGSRYCPECGTARPQSLRCGECGEVFPLALHLLDPETEARGIHCLACGARHDWRAPGAAPGRV